MFLLWMWPRDVAPGTRAPTGKSQQNRVAFARRGRVIAAKPELDWNTNPFQGHPVEGIAILWCDRTDHCITRVANHVHSPQSQRIFLANPKRFVTREVFGGLRAVFSCDAAFDQCTREIQCSTSAHGKPIRATIAALCQCLFTSSTSDGSWRIKGIVGLPSAGLSV